MSNYNTKYNFDNIDNFKDDIKFDNNNYIKKSNIKESKYYDLPNGKRIEEYKVPYISEKDDVLLLMDKAYYLYSDLPQKFRNDPDVLKRAILNFKSLDSFRGFVPRNPINYAGIDAITDEIIDLLGDDIADIRYTADIVKIPRFVLKLYENNIDVDYAILPKEVRSNPDVLKEALVHYENVNGKENPLCYAEAQALNMDNILLGLEKGFNGPVTAALLDNMYFFVLCIKLKKSFVPYGFFPEIIKNNDELMAEYMEICPAHYAGLNELQRNKPEILKRALLHYKSNMGTNPICYALDDALTEENITIAVSLGNIEHIAGSAFLKNELFNRINIINKGSFVVPYYLLPKSILNNDDLMLQYISSNPGCYCELNATRRNDPVILKMVIEKYMVSYFDGFNPLSYANEKALTEENIRLGIVKGCIRANPNCALIHSELFYRISIEKKFDVQYRDFPENIREDDKLMLLYMEMAPEDFLELNLRQRNNPTILKVALENYKAASANLNPISFALEDALTEENINLALEKGNIEITVNSALASNKYFVLELLKKSYIVKGIENISEILKSDPEIALMLANIRPKILSNSVIGGSVNQWSPRGWQQKYKYFQAVIGIALNGEYSEVEVRGNSNIKNHYDGVPKVIDNLIALNPDLQVIGDSLKELEENPFYRAVRCSEYGVLMILIEGENAQIYFPKRITKQQLDVLHNLLSDELSNLTYRYLYRVNENVEGLGGYDEFYVYYDSNENLERDLNALDTLLFIKQNNIYSEELSLNDINTDNIPPSKK